MLAVQDDLNTVIERPFHHWWTQTLELRVRITASKFVTICACTCKCMCAYMYTVSKKTRQLWQVVVFLRHSVYMYFFNSVVRLFIRSFIFIPVSWLAGNIVLEVTYNVSSETLSTRPSTTPYHTNFQIRQPYHAALSQFTSSFTSQAIFVIITTLSIHYSFTLTHSMLKNYLFNKSFSVNRLLVTPGLSSRITGLTGFITFIGLFLVRFSSNFFVLFRVVDQAGYPSVFDCTLNTHYRIMSYRTSSFGHSSSQSVSQTIVSHSLSVISYIIIIILHYCYNPETRFRPISATVVSAEPFSHGTGTLRCLQKEMATYRHWSVLVARPRRCLTLSNPVHVESCPLT